MTELINRYDFSLIFDVQNGNPNGDPDAGNLPRLDPETGRGLVTDVCLKRKVRNYVEMLNRPECEIYVREKAILNQQHERAYQAIGAGDELKDKDHSDKSGKKSKRKGGEYVGEARNWMCRNFYDIRTFGAVMSTGVNCGQVRGPVQMTFAQSVDQIHTLEHSITRMAVATEAEAEKQSGDNRTMGRKNTIPYGLYLSYGFVSPFLARQTCFSIEDLALFWDALANMFEHDRSAARGLMSTRKLIVFKHETALGNAPAHALFDRIKIKRKDESTPPRKFGDYEIVISRENLPAGVEIIEKV
ncbi:MAG: type I-C CRISPR-associated protein Cas7/Csd2 [Planctomycetes bacterium]|nr:type I-C CRISPR-associated protein Cas7/Csd2 [Planctomycetota bacterium]